jgi:hypothetical protein
VSFLRTSLVTFVLVSISSFGCTSPETNEVGEASGSMRTLRVGRVAHLPTYYLARIDPRRCAAPACTGISISAANQKITQCGRGSYAEECPISDFDFSGFGDPNDVDTSVRAALSEDFETTRVVFLGTMMPRGFGETILQVQMAWVALDERVLTGELFATRFNGVVCVAAPCPSYDQELVNRGEGQLFHGFDFDGLPMHANDSSFTTPALYSDYGLVISGENITRDDVGPAGQGIYLKASQVFVPIAISSRRTTPRRFPSVPVILSE